MTAPTLTPVQIAVLLAEGRFDLSDEKACQAEMEAWLQDRLPTGTSLIREAVLGPGERPDFLIGGVVIEVKMNSASPRDIIRQLERYARHDVVEAIILASNRAVRLPHMLEGVPVFTLSLGKAWL